MIGELKEYNQKRNFDRTLEPEGEAEYSEEGLRFVIQHHMARREHYDLRLEWAGVLLSFAVPKGPSYKTKDRRLAVQVEDHPLEYRNFEGTIPKGEYGGGVVMLWDEGFWEPYINVEEGLREGVLKFVLKGRRLKGKWALIRIKGSPGEKADNWLFLKEKDEYVKDTDGISGFVTSIRTGRTMEEIEKGEDEKFIKNPFQVAQVQLAKLVKTIPEDENWLYELKYDGYRIMAFVEGNSARLITRNGNDFAHRFHDIVSSLLSFSSGRAMVLDDEIAVTDAAGKTDFQALQNYMKNPKGKNLTYIVFDLLALDGVDLRNRPLIKRKEMLETLMKDTPKNLYYSRYIRGKGKESFAVACEADMEGIIGKKADSVYSGTRNGDWIKVKCDKRQEFVIGGYTRSEKRTNGISSLLLGVYEKEELVFAGRAGTGFSEAEMKRLEEKFDNIQRMASPFRVEPKLKADERIIWLEPVFVAEIKFAEWTQENLLRQASYKGLREDKDPKEVRREKAEKETEEEIEEETLPQSSVEEEEKPVIDTDSRLRIQGVKITNPDKVLFDDPKITKEEVIRYYAEVSIRMLPYVSHRLLSAIRCPKGISQTCFFKKHPGPGSKQVIAYPVSTSSGETEDYFYVENAAGLIEEAQMGTLEFHIWGSSVETLEMPDMMVFDLDPDEGMELDRVRQGVLDVRGILTELSLNSYLKTSGGKGYHVVVPLKPVASWEVFHDFARRVAEVMEQKWPDRYTSNVRKSKRKGKIFIDWMRNGRGATSIAPYSLRARKGARVSMPISWDELDTVAPDSVTMKEALIRSGGDDPWNGFFENNQMLK
ncbi:DNA ligase D [Mobilitalea sibirica]|uniref:DNA ligase (ATP) n=1 Tax=Mobilitalea sibirica TaxID=1462919 RepID=A0A8J7H0H4_9FIRM|nr:DNA ligase D [Mobilitalea sibirica]MBH1939598.1 DNA ligase D [Mobilitalea sibirica]